MKIPSYIERAIERRIELQKQLKENENIIMDFLVEHNIVSRFDFAVLLKDCAVPFDLDQWSKEELINLMEEH